MSNQSTLNIYSLLIGVNYYFPNTLSDGSSYSSLQGAVRDINLVESFLKEIRQVRAENIFKLTASSSPNSESSLESPEDLPTYKNIVSKFQELTKIASAGDLVYIHYSGHGGRTPTLLPDLKGENGTDESIVPTDIGLPDGQYLRDIEIAKLLQDMVDKELIVTIVLDSCHSGGATRGDMAIRGVNTVDTTVRPTDSFVSLEELANNWAALSQNNTRGLKRWLPESNNYVLLAACRPSEFAFEYAVNGKERHGALTYWMIDTLRNNTSEFTYQSLYNRVKGIINSKFPLQLPMLLGEGDRLVFGSETVSKPYTVNLTKVNEQQTEVTLDAGAAQGLSTGTRFAIYPFNTQDFTDKEQVLAVVEITKIKGSSSVAQVLLPEDGGIEVKAKLESGYPALLLAAPINLIRRVRFYSKEAGDKEHQLPSELVNKQSAALEAVRQALAGNGWVVEVEEGEGEEGDYQVAVGREGEYEICIGMPLTNLRPSLMIDDPDAPEKVVKRLVHLAKYQATAELDNPNSPLAKYLEVELLDQNKQPFPDPNNIVLASGTVCLRITNNYSRSLNIAILDLEPTWGIFQVDIEEIDAPFYELASGETKDLDELEFEAPEGEGYEQGKEILKVFAVKGLANFKWLTLPPLDEEQQSKGNLNLELENKKEELAAKGIKRGDELTVNPLNTLLATIGAEINEPPKITRSFRRKPNSNSEWVTKEVQVTVKSS